MKISVRNSLGMRIVIILCVIMTCFFVIMNWIITSNQNKLIRERNVTEAVSFSNLVMNAIRYPMLTGDQDVIQRQFDNYADLEAIDAISLLDHTGVVKRSTDRSVLGQMSLADNLSDALSGNIVENVEHKKSTGLMVFSRMLPIKNEDKCWACHGKERKVLGVLRVTLSLQRALADIKAMRTQNLFISILGLVSILILVTGFLYRAIAVPIRALEQGMKDVALGNLKQNITDINNDEIGNLTRMFNKMAADLNILVDKEKALVYAEQVKTEELATVNADLVTEIKERRRTEEKLSTAYRQFSDIIEFLPDATFVIDRDKRVIAWNKAIEDLTGLPKRDIIGKGNNAYAVPFYGTNRSVLVNLIFEADPSIEKTYRTFERKGDRLYIEGLAPNLFGGKGAYIWAVASPLYDSNGNTVGAIESVRDITLHRLNEDKILSSAQEWRMTFDSIKDLIAIIDKDRKFVRVNAAFAAAFNMKPNDVINTSCHSLMFSNEKPCNPCAASSVFTSASTEIQEFYISQLDRNYEITFSPIADQSGAVSGAVLVAKDITSRKDLEKKERLAQLGKLVADMAHEVNNPLMIISGRAQLSLMEEFNNDEVKNNLSIIMDECQRGKDIIQRLLKFSRRGKNEISSIDINKSIDNIVEILEHQFSLATIEIKRNYGLHLPQIMADERQLQEVFMNLFSNAREAMPQGGTIEITTLREHDMLKIIFKDTGDGMTPETLKRVCEPFFTTKEKGTGLGLSVCYGIIKGHGGELTFVSELQKGTAAVIQLPINR